MWFNLPCHQSCFPPPKQFVGVHSCCVSKCESLCLWTCFLLQSQKSCPSESAAVCERGGAKHNGLCRSTRAKSAISPETQLGILLLPAINEQPAKHANHMYRFLLAFVSSHASSPPIWYHLCGSMAVPVWFQHRLTNSNCMDCVEI